jgi:hypothetical protein
VLSLFKGWSAVVAERGSWSVLRVLGFGDGGDGFLNLSGVSRFVGELFRVFCTVITCATVLVSWFWVVPPF